MPASFSVTISRADLESKRAALAANGIALTGDCGELEHDGVNIDFNYVEPELTMIVLHKPLLYPESAIEAKIRELLASTTD